MHRRMAIASGACPSRLTLSGPSGCSAQKGKRHGPDESAMKSPRHGAYVQRPVDDEATAGPLDRVEPLTRWFTASSVAGHGEAIFDDSALSGAGPCNRHDLLQVVITPTTSPTLS